MGLLDGVRGGQQPARVARIVTGRHGAGTGRGGRGGSGGIGRTRTEAMEADILSWSLLQVAVYLCFSKQQHMGVNSAQHQ